MANCLDSPTVSPDSYGGGCSDITAKLKVTLSQEDYKTDSVVLVQKGAPNELLLVGTDTLSTLGFCLLMERVVETVNILNGKETQAAVTEQSSQPSLVKLAVVQLEK